jgi:hypothetical protein
MMGWVDQSRSIIVPPLAKYNLISIFEAHCAWVIADRTDTLEKETVGSIENMRAYLKNTSTSSAHLVMERK